LRAACIELDLCAQGDDQSTDGTEPSHSHFVGDQNCKRGWEWWLLKEARKRNPAIATYALPWGFPYAYDTAGPSATTGGTKGFTNLTVDYFISFLNCSRSHTDVDARIDYLGLYNEVGGIASPEWTVALRQRMDEAGFGGTKLVLPDIAGELPTAILDDLDKSTAYSAAVDILGVHYCGDSACAHSERVAVRITYRYRLVSRTIMLTASVDCGVNAPAATRQGIVDDGGYRRYFRGWWADLGRVAQPEFCTRQPNEQRRLEPHLEHSGRARVRLPSIIAQAVLPSLAKPQNTPFVSLQIFQPRHDGCIRAVVWPLRSLGSRVVHSADDAVRRNRRVHSSVFRCF
jgi:hypothetical protein